LTPEVNEMTPNVGPREQLVRMAVGAAALTAALCLPRLGAWRAVLAAAGLMKIATAVTRYCPVSALVGIDNTRGTELVHFDDNEGGVRERLNEMQHRVGATISRGGLRHSAAGLRKA
jgi:hypothetical protein